MSLDVYLTTRESIAVESKEVILIRRNGANEEISREEWDTLNPGVEPVTTTINTNVGDSCTVYSANITHNLNKMADAAGVYKQLWRPDEVEITQAKQLIEPLTAGLTLLKAQPDRFKTFNPENGWGNYEGLVSFVENYLEACKEYPDATVNFWR